MSEAMERAHETIEHHSHGQPDRWARLTAVLVSALAAILAVTEIGVSSTQNTYLTHHISVSDDYAFYQERYVRAVVKESEAELLASLPTAGDPAVQARIAQAKDYATRMRDDPGGNDGMKQLLDRAHAQEEVRNEAFHRYHEYEYAAGAIQIAIVLASVSIVTRVRSLTLASGVIGALAAVGAALVASGFA